MVLCLFAGQLAAQTAPHQRLGVEAKDNLDITVGTILELTPFDVNNSSGIDLDPSISMDFLFMQRFSLSIEVPAAFWLTLVRDAVPRVVGAIGDPSIAATYTFRLSDWRFGAELSYSHPLGIWNSYERTEKRIASGSGYPKLAASFSATRYLDPLIAGVRMGVETCLARQEGSSTTTKPLILSVSLFATEALNSVVALSAGLTPRLAWPRCIDGVPVGSGMTWSLPGSLSILFSEGNWTLRFGVSRLLSDYMATVVFNVGFSYTITKKE
ncbi:MAG: hypothetical protein NT061_11550 [Spirochaetes bacterium]|nr:hypothetical protein [Spirochaetota bacterium]